MKHNWELKSLEDVAQVQFGTRIVAKDTPPGKYFVYGGGGATFTTEKFNRENCMIVSRFAMSKECVRYVRGKFFLNDSGLSVATQQSYLSQSYLDKVLFSKQDLIYNLGRVAAQRNLNTKSFSDIKIPIPPMEVQEQIVAELDKLNEMIATRKEQLKELDNLAQSLFYDTFGDPISNPKGWKTNTYGNLFTIVSGGTPSTKEKNYWENGSIPWIGSNMCNDSILYETDGKFITELGLKNSSAKLLNPGTTLIAMVGATIGKTAYLATPVTTNQNIAAISLKENSLFSSMFIFYHSKFIYPLFKELGEKKFTIASLSFIKKLPFILPPLPLQQQFATQVESIERQKEIVEASISELQTLLDSRMDYWFN